MVCESGRVSACSVATRATVWLGFVGPRGSRVRRCKQHPPALASSPTRCAYTRKLILTLAAPLVELSGCERHALRSAPRRITGSTRVVGTPLRARLLRRYAQRSAGHNTLLREVNRVRGLAPQPRALPIRGCCCCCCCSELDRTRLQVVGGPSQPFEGPACPFRKAGHRTPWPTVLRARAQPPHT